MSNYTQHEKESPGLNVEGKWSSLKIWDRVVYKFLSLFIIYLFMGNQMHMTHVYATYSLATVVHDMCVCTSDNISICLGILMTT